MAAEALVDLTPAFLQIGVALGLGLLVGLQRESVASPLAGIRTFAMLTVLGAVTGMIATEFGGWVVGAAILGLVGLMVVGNLAAMHTDQPDPGLTTEVAMMLMFGVGLLVQMERTSLALVIGGLVAVLLQFKAGIRTVTGKLAQADVQAIMQFVLIALVILPVLPDRPFGPWSVLNPRQIWLMVVLIVGISLGSYIASRFIGSRAGVLVAGVLGGLISSTATTVSNARRTRSSSANIPFAALVIMIASAVVFVRVLAEIAVAGPALLPAAAPRIGALFAVLAGLALIVWMRGRGEGEVVPPQENPSELKPALLFAALYAVVLVAVAAARQYYGSSGLYAVAFLSGLTDVDAITLSTARLVAVGNVTPDLGWRAIVIAALSNLVFKAGAVLFLGSRRLFAVVAGLYAVVVVAGVVLLVAG